MGSTAVPGLPAKPIIDMLAVVDDIETAPRSPEDLLGTTGWVHAPEPFDASERKLSFCFPDVARRTHHLHVVEERSGNWRGWLAFRDYLRYASRNGGRIRGLEVPARGGRTATIPTLAMPTGRERPTSSATSAASRSSKASHGSIAPDRIAYRSPHV